MKITIEEAEILIKKLKYKLRDLSLSYVNRCSYDCIEWYDKTNKFSKEFTETMLRIKEIEKYCEEVK